MSGIEVVYDPDQSVAGYLKEDINEGIDSTSENYLKATYATRDSQAATTFKLTMDRNCERESRRLDEDITKGAFVHPDCRYLEPATSTYEVDNVQLIKPITHIFLSRNGEGIDNRNDTVQCTDDINAGRYRKFGSSSDSLKLCWENREGIQDSLYWRVVMLETFC